MTDELNELDQIQKDVRDTISAGQATLRGKVVNRLAQEKLNEREQLLFDGVKKYDELRKEAAKANKADNIVIQRGPGGESIRIEQFTEQADKKRKEAEKRLADFKAAYLLALKGRPKDPKDPNSPREPDFEPLKKALGKGGGGNQAPNEPNPESEPTG